MPFYSLIWVFLGGGCGAVSRYVLGLLMLALFPYFPLGTLLVNLVGSAVAGFLLGRFPSVGTPTWRLFLMTGFLGGFTTFSAFSLETAQMWIEQHRGEALLNLGLNLLGGLLAVALGYWLGRQT